MKIKINRKKEIIKIRAEIEIENREVIEKMNKTKCWVFFEKTKLINL